MGFIKLTEPGSAHVMTVAKVEDDRSGNWPDWKFTDVNGDTLTIPQKALERQLARLQVDSPLELVGAHVRFSRSDKPGANGKLFWNADLAAAPSATPSKRLAPPPVTTAPPRQPAGHGGARIPDMDGPPDWSDVPTPDEAEGPYAEPAPTPRERVQGDADARRAAVERAYLALYGRVAKAVVKHHIDANAVVNVPDLAAAVQAATATIWISWKDTGVRP